MTLVQPEEKGIFENLHKSALIDISPNRESRVVCNPCSEASDAGTGCQLSYSHTSLYPTVYLGWSGGAYVEDYSLLYPYGRSHISPFQFYEGMQP